MLTRPWTPPLSWASALLCLTVSVGCGGGGTDPQPTNAPTEPATTAPQVGETLAPSPTLGEEDTDTPSGEDTETPEGEDTDTPEGEDTETPEGEDTDTPSGEDTDTPSGEDTDTPSGEDTDTPGGEGTGTPGGEGTATPGGEGTATPGGEDTATPGGEDTATPDGTQPPPTEPLIYDDDEDGYTNIDDCDDTDPDVNPGAAEICDGKDNNCDEEIDETGQTLFFPDEDGDGFGTGSGQLACSGGEGLATTGGDCDDVDPAINPGATEVCDGRDNNCDSESDEDLLSQGYVDTDSDGFGAGAAETICTGTAGYASVDGDCAPSDNTVYPGATEVCDTKDNDCDTEIDEDGQSLYYTDADGDGYGTGTGTLACTPSAGQAAQAGDCNDADQTIKPGAAESCNNVDDNCDGAVDEGTTQQAYLDSDKDGYGTGDPQTVCDGAAGYAAVAGDCNDRDKDINPGATEVCDGKDNDCDSRTDENLTEPAYVDGDSDGYGKSGSVQVCPGTAGYAEVPGDCDDTNAAINPAATEVCDGKDNDCDAIKDEGVTTTGYTDGDGDTYGAGAAAVICEGAAGYASRPGDCNDQNKDINPGATEVCDSKDNDCDSQIDEGVSSTGYVDADGDTYGTGGPLTYCAGTAGYASRPGDCDDAAAAINPGAAESCDGKDNDCDGAVDENGQSTWYKDSDGDGYGLSNSTQQACGQPSGYAAQSGDCDDGNNAINPGATEVCDSKDNDCDGATDESGGTTWYKDGDTDTYGDASVSQVSCTKPSGYVADKTDCNDSDATTHPGATEVCDGKDNDCDTTVDEGVTTTWYRDTDNDGFGVSSSTTQACSKPSGYAVVAGDCNDNSASVNPAATDIPGNGIDEDCDGLDAQYTDFNQDGFPDLIISGYYNGSAYAVNSSIYFGSESGLVTANRKDLPTKGARTFCVADFDDDGWTDVAFANQYDGSSYAINSVLYWGAPGGFSTADLLELPTLGAQSCTAADLDDDGDTDLVFSNHYDGTSYSITSYVYYNVGGTFSRANRASLPTEGNYEARAVDLNDDGYLELIFSGYISGTSSSNSYATNSYIYWGAATGYSTASRTSLPGSGIWRRPAVADLNNDGFLDIVLSSHYDGDYTTSSYIYFGPTYAASGRTELPTTGGNRPVVTDFDGDTWLDILLPSYYDGDDSVVSNIYFGSSRGYSTSNRQQLPSARVYDVDVADLDDDGYDEISMAVYYDGDYSTSSRVFFGSNTGFSTSRVLDLPTVGATDVASSDMDGDGWLDLAFASHYNGSSYSSTGYIYWGSARGIANSARQALPTAGGVFRPWVGDLDKDGFEDVVLPAYGTNSGQGVNSIIYWGSAGGLSSSDVTTLPNNGPYDVCVGDLNGDSFNDLVFANYYNGAHAVNSHIYWGSASGYSTASRTVLPTQGGYACAIGDADGDGDLDVAFANHYNGSYTIDSYLYYNMSGSFGTANRLSLPTQGATGVTIGDVTGDGRPDIWFSNHYNGSSYNGGSYLYIGTSSGFSTSSRQTFNTHGPISPAHFIDVNKDNRKDIVIFNYYDGDDSVNSYIYYGAATGFTDANKATLPGNRTPNGRVVDLDRDGALDVVMSTYYDGDYSVNSYVYWGSLSGFSTNDRQSLPGEGNYYMDISDLNLDGYPDLVMPSYHDGDYSTASAVWYGSATGYATSRRTLLPTTGSLDARTGDLDGDGLDDILFAQWYGGSDYATSSMVYWNSLRGFASSSASSYPSLGALDIGFAE